MAKLRTLTSYTSLGAQWTETPPVQCSATWLRVSENRRSPPHTPLRNRDILDFSLKNAIFRGFCPIQSCNCCHMYVKCTQFTFQSCDTMNQVLGGMAQVRGESETHQNQPKKSNFMELCREIPQVSLLSAYCDRFGNRYGWIIICITCVMQF